MEAEEFDDSLSDDSDGHEYVSLHAMSDTFSALHPFDMSKIKREGKSQPTDVSEVTSQEEIKCDILSLNAVDVTSLQAIQTTQPSSHEIEAK